MSGGLCIAYVFGSPHLYFKPVLDAAVTHISLGDTTESGSSGSLLISGSDRNVCTVIPSMEVGTDWWLASGLLVRPFLRGGGNVP